MKKYIYTLSLMLAYGLASCAEEIKSESKDDSKVASEEKVEEKAKYDETSPDYKMAMILCDCFETFNEEDPDAQLDAVGCFMEGMSDPDVQNSSEDGTMKILEEVCPTSHVNFTKWQEKVKNPS